MIVDAHVHFWRLARGVNTALTLDMGPIHRDREPPDLEPMLAAAGVDAVVLVQASETLGENLYHLGLAERFGWIAGVVGWLDPASSALDEEVAALRSHPRFKGVRPVRDDNRSIAWMLDPALTAGWNRLAASGLVIDLLVQDWRELPLALRLIERHPAARFVLDHCGKPDIAGGHFDGWAKTISLLALNPNLSCKLSGLMNCAGPGTGADGIERWSDHVLVSFGADRVLWASDWPPLDLAGDYEGWSAVSDALLTACSPQETAQIRGGTAARIYGLKREHGGKR